MTQLRDAADRALRKLQAQTVPHVNNLRSYVQAEIAAALEGLSVAPAAPSVREEECFCTAYSFPHYHRTTAPATTEGPGDARCPECEQSYHLSEHPDGCPDCAPGEAVTEEPGAEREQLVRVIEISERDAFYSDRAKYINRVGRLSHHSEWPDGWSGGRVQFPGEDSAKHFFEFQFVPEPTPSPVQVNAAVITAGYEYADTPSPVEQGPEPKRCICHGPGFGTDLSCPVHGEQGPGDVLERLDGWWMYLYGQTSAPGYPGHYFGDNPPEGQRGGWWWRTPIREVLAEAVAEHRALRTRVSELEAEREGLAREAWHQALVEAKSVLSRHVFRTVVGRAHTGGTMSEARTEWRVNCQRHGASEVFTEEHGLRELALASSVECPDIHIEKRTVTTSAWERVE